MITKTRWVIRRTKWGYSLFEDGDLIASADSDSSLLFGSNMLFGLGGRG
jgi:hypothetical protein